jgi:CheY-like chemotaxis protein
MESADNEFFDLTILLRQGDLNTRGFAASGQAVTVGEYFGKVSELLKLAPDVERSLTKFSDKNGGKDDYKSIDSMVSLLTSLECDKFVADLYSLLDAYENKGNWREAAFLAKQLKEDIGAFYSRINKAAVKAKPEGLPDDTLPLGKYIAQLDEEEANRKPLILAVDDSPVILRSVSSVLSGDYKVFTLPKPTELSKVLQKVTPELFILDYQMPELSGFDLIPIIRGFEEHKDTPIIFLTSAGTIDNVTASLALGASDFIVKPFKPEILLEKIEKYIVKKKLF